MSLRRFLHEDDGYGVHGRVRHHAQAQVHQQQQEQEWEAIPLEWQTTNDEKFQQQHYQQLEHANEMLRCLKKDRQLNNILRPVSNKYPFENDEWMGDRALEYHLGKKLHKLKDSSPGRSTDRVKRGVSNETLALFYDLIGLEIVIEEKLASFHYKRRADAFEVLIFELDNNKNHQVAKALLMLLITLLYVYALGTQYKQDDKDLEYQINVALTYIRHPDVESDDEYQCAE
ncbi:hypothetical protein SAMD00019534_082240 [Acytostelium subglobosum LB1]|uniref:hypothetical protein n=1 Tax=Acytostelium subglobosum LB1 TaxID=1410327 RepID=UPI00064513C5|nr:hypothetical protein SAMD00019534_082240 [Acytostelium subglobosum LB1]GAM25049.1 hypothetical protein SAMD00019534_082240 [Acytostelium subglobosum LB1]|eukprot:XP_012752138.1 hypothetical protein SAMD00019534_082240 [Acytostelium subglobosum LB1]